MDNTQDKIIQATIEWIQKDDYKKLSMRKLAATIGMTTGAIYKYFQNKEALFYQVSIVLSRRISEELTIDSKVSPQNNLLSLAKRFCVLIKKQPKLVNFLFFNPSLDEFYQHMNHDFKFYDLVMGLVQQVNQGGISDQQFFMQIWSFIQGYSLLILKGVADYDSQLVELTLDEMIGGSKK